MKYISNNLNYANFFYFLLSLSLLVGFYFNEDASAGGASHDFYLTWKFNVLLKEIRSLGINIDLDLENKEI